MDEKIEGGGLYRNTVSYFGGLIIAVSVLLIFLFLLLGFSLKLPSPYIGIFTYMIFPVFLMVGSSHLPLRVISGESPATSSRPEGGFALSCP